MATLYVRARSLPDGSRRFDVKYRRGGRYSHIEHGGTFRTQRDANARKAKIAEWLAAGLNPKTELRRIASPSTTIADLQRQWLAGRRAVADQTLAHNRSQAKRIEKDLGRFEVSDFAVADVVDWVGELSQDFAPRTVSAYVSQLRKVLDLHDGLNVARSKRVELPRFVGAELNPPDAPDVLAMLQALKGIPLITSVVMEQLGSRVSETLALTADDIHQEVVRFRRETTKTSKSRFVPASPLLLEVLREHVPFRMSRENVSYHLRRQSDGTIWPHLLRHRRATLWHQQGVYATQLAHWLGHARASISLDVYSHVKPLKEIPAHSLAALFR